MMESVPAFHTVKFNRKENHEQAFVPHCDSPLTAKVLKVEKSPEFPAIIKTTTSFI